MKKRLLSLFVLLMFSIGTIFACSSFSWHTEDGLHLLGRTYDMFGDLSGNRITVVAPGYELATSPSGTETTVTMEHGFIGNGILGSTAPIMTDGMNDQGLMGCLLNFPRYGYYNTQEGEGNLDLHPAFFVPYILGTCATLDDVEEAVKHINLTDELIFGAHMSVHYIFSDGSGEAIIIEPDEGGITVHRNTIGVMANAPDYNWQKTNLKNYVAVSNLDTPPLELLGETIQPFGNGTGGSFGLPGGYSSPARFVRMAFMKEFAPKGTDEMDSVTRMFNSFGVVYIPDGILRKSADSTDCEQTLCTSVMCSESLTYYFSPYTDRRVSAVSVPAAIDKAGDGNLMYIDIPAEQDVNRLI